MLEKQNLIRRTDNNEYVLARNLDTIDFWTFYQSLPYPLPRRSEMGTIPTDGHWMQRIAPALIESDEYLAAKLSVPLSTILDER